MTTPPNNPEEEPKKRSDEYWTGIAFLPIGITFFILGLTNTTYLAVGLPFLILGLTMITIGKNKHDDDDEDGESSLAEPDTDPARQ